MQDALANAVERCRERSILIPTYAQMRNPELVPDAIRNRLKQVGLWALDSANLFRITWKNQPVESGGGFGGVNFVEMPSALTGVPARIFVMIGKYFPTGAHKVGATFGPLVERLVHGRFDPTRQKALWPSTGNYCRGGVYNSRLLGCQSIAVLPEGMSQERFDWLREMGAEVYATPGSESNVKEIYDKVKQLLGERGDEIVNLNQFAEFGNPLWHYAVTGPAMEEIFRNSGGKRFAGVFLTQGSAGTLGCADYLRQKFPLLRVAAGESIQCPTMLQNGYGAHRIEGIGDKHVPWVHNLRNMDMAGGIDDEDCIRLIRLFNEPAGREALLGEGVPQEIIEKLPLLGISSTANLLGCIKMAKYYELTADDCLFTVATDSIAMYQSRLREETERRGDYTPIQAAKDFDRRLAGASTEHMMELGYQDRRRIHNLKYFTWIEQQGKTVEELNAQWYDDRYWLDHYEQVNEWDRKIEEFNERTGVLKNI
jgi:cysteine synthase